MIVSQAGQCSDEIFTGYLLFHPNYLREPNNISPQMNFPNVARRIEHPRTEENMAKTHLQGTSTSSCLTSQLFSNTLTLFLMTTAYPKSSLKPSMLRQDQENLLDPQISYSESISPKILAKHRIEGRTPFLHHHLTEYPNSLPRVRRFVL